LRFLSLNPQFGFTLARSYCRDIAEHMLYTCSDELSPSFLHLPEDSSFQPALFPALFEVRVKLPWHAPLSDTSTAILLYRVVKVQ